MVRISIVKEPFMPSFRGARSTNYGAQSRPENLEILRIAPE